MESFTHTHTQRLVRGWRRVTHVMNSLTVPRWKNGKDCRSDVDLRTRASLGPLKKTLKLNNLTIFDLFCLSFYVWNWEFHLETSLVRFVFTLLLYLCSRWDTCCFSCCICYLCEYVEMWKIYGLFNSFSSCMNVWQQVVLSNYRYL